MANLEEIITSKNESDTQWKTQQQADRDSVTEMQDQGIEMIVSDPDQYIRYLTMQGDNPTYSAGNVAIVLAGMEKYHVSCGNLFWFSVKIEDSLTGSHIQ